ncbi:FAD-dependent oxidoreductase [Pseudalkalibacillus decolorationis]|uniref:FAD-dependent oxidoreductase n=1 Tax=Pseudalkalibacillus decolorationis TaxID=163879 RepID=UPI002147EC20|nr:FAD-dependent oxidoreductase [Pseudalkalibacillus decolorationis]
MTKEMNGEIIIIGGGLGGSMAALSAAKLGKKVILTEETARIGGQLTSQLVPPDEHKWIEQFGCTRTYREFRNRVRAYYHHNYPLTAKAKQISRLNPGNALVSRISHDPRVSLAVLHDMLAPYFHSGRITLLLQHKAEAAETNGDEILAVTVRNLETNNLVTISGSIFIDATECGDVLPLAGAEYVTGAESVNDTGEPHVLSRDSEPMDMQSITHCFAVDYIEGENHTIEKPQQYKFWKSYQADFLEHKQLSWFGPDAATGKSKLFTLFPQKGLFSLWEYRRALDKSLFEEGYANGDLSLINWPQNDYWLGPIYEVSEEERLKHLKGARQLSLSLLYWMQTEAPREDGKTGFPGMRLRRDVAGTEDGLAMYPYIRESRRIKAEVRVKEQDISADTRVNNGVNKVRDSVGIGSYHIDLHPTVVTNQLFYTLSLPFQIPLGALLPIRMHNLIAGSKNIGATHITNGCFRVHPVEWNIGESAGYLAAYAHEKGIEPRAVRQNEEQLDEFQSLLKKQGIELEWPHSVLIE